MEVHDIEYDSKSCQIYVLFIDVSVDPDYPLSGRKYGTYGLEIYDLNTKEAQTIMNSLVYNPKFFLLPSVDLIPLGTSYKYILRSDALSSIGIYERSTLVRRVYEGMTSDASSPYSWGIALDEEAESVYWLEQGVIKRHDISRNITKVVLSTEARLIWNPISRDNILYWLESDFESINIKMLGIGGEEARHARTFYETNESVMSFRLTSRYIYLLRLPLKIRLNILEHTNALLL